MAAGDHGLAIADDGAHQHPALDDGVQPHQRLIPQLTVGADPQLHNVGAAVGKGVPVQKAGQPQQPLDLVGGLLFRVDGQGKGKHILQAVDLLGVFRVADAADGMDLGVDAVGGGAAQQV